MITALIAICVALVLWNIALTIALDKLGDNVLMNYATDYSLERVSKRAYEVQNQISKLEAYLGIELKTHRTSYEKVSRGNKK